MSDGTIKSTLQGFIHEGEGLLERMGQMRNPQVDALTYVARESLKNFTRDAVGEFAREVAEHIGFPGTGPKRYVKKYLRDQEKRSLQEQRRNQEIQFQSEYQSWMRKIQQFLSNVSVLRSSLNEGGNSSELLSKLAKIDEFARVRTRVRRTIAFLKSLGSQKLLYSMEIPSLLRARAEEKNKDAYKILEELEINMRKFIERQLGKVSPNWWKERVPEDVRKNAEERKTRDEARTSAHLHPIHYVDFPDYIKIVSRKDNWKHVFKQFFKDREIISAKFREIEPIRNAIAHPRPLTNQQFAKLKLYAEEIEELMKNGLVSIV